MANFVFISVHDINAEGIRILSSVLKKKGHKTSIIFIQKNGYPYNQEKRYIKASRNVEKEDWIGVDAEARAFSYSKCPEINQNEQKILLSLISKLNPDIIGFTVTTPLKKTVSKLTNLLKNNFSIPIIWGGPEASMNPENCLEYCDIVCIGEAEKTVEEMARLIDKKQDMKRAKNLVYKSKNEDVIKNPINPLITELDKIPFKDISSENKFLIEGNRLTENFREFSYGGNYHLSSSRGCPFNCSYCCENFFKQLYCSQKFLRRRSPKRVIEELKQAKKALSFTEITFEDEIFSLDEGWLKEFKELYLKEIKLPFNCYIYPISNAEKIIPLLKETGLASTTLSLQSGSQRINKEVFNRILNEELFLKTAKILKSLGIVYSTDIITYNLFEREEDLQANLRILRQMPKPFHLDVNRLYLMNGTKVYQLAKDYLENGGKSLPKEVFDRYVRLYHLAAKENRLGSTKERAFRFLQRIFNKYKHKFGNSPFFDLINLPLLKKKPLNLSEAVRA